MKSRAKSLTEGTPLKVILLFAIPIFFGNLFQILYSLIDTKIVGSTLGESALASVGSVTTLYNLLAGFFNGLTLGFSVIVARHYGSGDDKALKKSVATALVLGGSTVVVIILSVATFLRPILGILQVPANQLEASYSYIVVLVWGMFITFSYNLCANLLRAIGDSLTPLIFLVISSVVNVVLDYWFILGFDMGVAGAAYATAISQLLSVILCLVRIYRSFPVLHVTRSDFRLEAKQMMLMYQSGLSMGLMSSLVNFGTVTLQTGINTLGNQIIVAHAAARKVFEIWMLPVSVMGATMATYCGQNYGAMRYDRIRKGMKSVLLLGTCWAAVVFVLTHLISPYLISFIASTKNEEILYWGTMYLRIDMSFIIATVLIVILRNSMQGFGDCVTPIFSSFIELVGKLVFAFVIVKRFGYWGIIFAEPVIWFIMVIPLIVMTLRNPIFKKTESYDDRKEGAKD